MFEHHGTLVEDKTFADWLVFVGLSALASAVLVVANPFTGLVPTLTAAGIILAVTVVYWFLARPSLAGIRENSPRAIAYAVLAILGFTIAVVLNPWANLALFALAPQMFLLLTPWLASGSIVLLNALPLLVRIVDGSLAGADLIQSVGTSVFVIAFSIFISSRMLAVSTENDERRRLIEQLHEREAEVAALSAARGASAERARIAREMHDTLAQGFTSIITLGHATRAELDSDLQAARRHVEAITATAQENLAESRRIIAALTPAPLDDASLAQAVRRVVAAFAEETGVVAVFETPDAEVSTSPSQQVVLLRVVQESLANIRKHARASRVRVSLERTGDDVLVRIVDDGVGFDPHAVRVSENGGFGLRGMASRVAEAGGDFTVHSDSSAGTTVTARVPLANGGSR
ncbi:sensor histidine kinase [Rathayibacter sp. YIM 133350]|uniref:sensor histidine kinase n=1 Tax=Rathayibacter sp. YIM 133350 TaxID=3131992 RepID=UPI00307FA686